MSFPMRYWDGAWTGTVADTMTVAAVDRLAAALARHVARNVPGRRRAIVGYDTRFLSETFAERLAGGLMEAGLTVVLSTRPCPTAAVSHAVAAEGAALGVVITGGSAGPEVNGVVVRSEAGAPLGPARVARLEAALRDESIHTAEMAGALQPLAHERMRGAPPTLAPIAPRVDLLRPYFESLCLRVPLGVLRRVPPTRIVVDAMHGTAGRYVRSLLRGSRVEVITLHGSPDPTFRGVGAPDPLDPTRLAALRRAVVRRRASWGCAFNADASRMALVDHTGEIISPSLYLPVMFEYLVGARRMRGGAVRTIATDPVFDAVAEGVGRRCLEVPVGLATLAHQASQTTAMLAGDHEGAVVLGDHLADSDPFLLVMLLLEMTAVTGVTVEGLAADLERRFWPVKTGHRRIEADAGLLRDRLEEMREDPPPQVGGVEVRQVVLAEGLKLHLRDGAWLLMRLERGDTLGCLDAGGQTSASVGRTLDAGADLLIGGAGRRLLG